MRVSVLESFARHGVRLAVPLIFLAGIAGVSRAARMFSTISGRRSRRVAARNALRLAALAMMAVPLLAGMPLAAQTAQFTGAVATLAVPGGGFVKPFGVAVDQHGNVIVADTGNAAVKEILAAGGYTAVKTLASGIPSPQGIAVDGSGNIYVTDGLTQQVLEILAVNGSIPANPTISPLGGTFSFCSPEGLAVDQSENVYVADECNDAVDEILAASGDTMVKTLSSAFITPWGVAVDQSGDVWVTDTSAHLVREILAVNGSIPANPAIIAPSGGSGIRCPHAIAVDGSGNVYVTDVCYDTVFEMPEASGYSTVNSLGGGYNLPMGLAASSGGMVFVADTYNSAVEEILAAGNFGPVNVGSANTNPVSLYFTFGASGALGSTSVLTQGAPGLDFTDAGYDTCTANEAYSAGETCGVNVTFKPEAPGPRSGAAELVDTSGNVLATGDLQGTGIGPLVNFMPGTLSQAVSHYAFGRPVAVAVDASSNLYIADAAHYEVYEFLAKSGYIIFNQLGPGFLNPQGVAVDGSGNVYVTDGDTGAVFKILAVNGTIPANPTITTLTSFANPTGVAVDGSGNVYVADPTKGAVYEIRAVNGTIPPNPTVTTLVSFPLQSPPVGSPEGVAVDGSGNVFVADLGGVYEILAVNGSVPSNPTVKSLGTPSVPFAYWAMPWGVAVDGSGNAYVSDPGSYGVYEILAASGYATVNTLSQAANYPWGVAVDASRNVYYVIADSNSESGTLPPGEAAVEKIDYADPPSLSFATTAVGSTSTDSPQTVTLENVGNAALTFPTPATLTSPSFPLAASSTCPQLSPETLAPGATCTYAVSFSPTTAGNLSGSLVLTDNNLNTPSPYAAQSIALNGMAPETSDFGLGNSGTITVTQGSTTGNTSTITVTPSNGFTGPVNLSCSVTTIPTGAISPATCAVTPSVTISGTTAQTATLTVNTTSTTTLGAYAVTVTGTAGSITQMTTVDVTVTASFSLSSNPSAFPLTAGVNTGNTSAITVTPANGFAGAVNLTCSVTGPTGATSPATCVVTPSVTISGSAAQTATLTVNTTSTTTSGAYEVTVTGTAGSTTQMTTVDVTVTASFSLSSNPSAFPLTAGVNTGNTSAITVTPASGFSGAINLTCSVTGPTGATSPATCVVTPSVTISGSAAQTATLSVTTTSSTTLGTYMITVTGTAGSITQATTVSVTVYAPVSGSFFLDTGITQFSLKAGTSGQVTITVNASPAFTGNVALTAAITSNTSGSQVLPTFSFSPNPVIINSFLPETSTLTIAAPADSGALVRPNTRGDSWYAAGGATLACLLLFGIPARRRRWRATFAAMLIGALVGGVLGCNTGLQGSTKGTPYVVTVTGTSGAITETTSFTVTVTP